jgi:hypothetical protein
LSIRRATTDPSAARKNGQEDRALLFVTTPVPDGSCAVMEHSITKLSFDQRF